MNSISDITAAGAPSARTRKGSAKRKAKSLSLVSMFSGCGGLDAGFHGAGFETVWANDISADACKTFETNLGSIHHGDVRPMDPPALRSVDVLAAGFPCQPFSNAGSRKGVQDHRGTLFDECFRFIEELRPKVVLFENVRGLISTKLGDDYLLIHILKSLDDIGYNPVLRLVNAADYGVPQNRLRLIILASSKTLKQPIEFPELLPRTDLSIGRAIGDLRDDHANQQELLRLNPQAIQIGAMVPEGGSWKNIPYEKLPPRLQFIRDNMRRYRWPNFYRRFHRAEIAGTITAAFKPENAGVWHPYRQRVMSVREIARIQSFPDEFIFEAASVRAKYEMIGNAIPPKLAESFARHISGFLAGERPASLKSLPLLEHGFPNKPIRPSDPPLHWSAKLL
jgi:DNA (cytosine-5)-methyltransferase 1